MTSKKTAYHFVTWTFKFSYIVHFHVFVVVWEIITVLGTNSISTRTPLSKQNVFSTDVCKLI